MNKYKINFTQFTKGIEHCEAVIEAASQVEALQKFSARDFTVYLCTKQELERVADTDDIENIEQIS